MPERCLCFSFHFDAIAIKLKIQIKEPTQTDKGNITILLFIATNIINSFFV